MRRMLPGVRAVLSFFESYQERERVAADAAVVALFRLGPVMAERQCAAGRGRRVGAVRHAAADGVRLGGGVWRPDRSLPSIALASGSCGRPSRRCIGTTARKLYADTPSKKQFSQHANTLAVLGDVITGPAARELMLRTLDASRASPSRPVLQVLCSRRAGEGRRGRQLSRTPGRLARHARARPDDLRGDRRPSRRAPRAPIVTPGAPARISRSSARCSASIPRRLDSAASASARISASCGAPAGSVPHPKGSRRSPHRGQAR